MAFKREGVELAGSFTAAISAELKVGEFGETIVVSGESPVVDVQSARREVTLKSDVLQSIPNVRSYNAMVVVVPGVVTNLNDTVTGTATTQFPIHGGRNNEGVPRPHHRGVHVLKKRTGCPVVPHVIWIHCASHDSTSR